MSDDVCAAAAARIVLAALLGICSSALLFGTHICFGHTAHAALSAHRLGGQYDAAEGLCITVLGDLQ